jgi:hypothetical protein
VHAAIDIRALAWASAATVLAVACGAVALRLAAEGPSPWDPDFSAMGIAGAVTFGLPGALAAAHAPRNAIGWLMLAIGLCLGVAELCVSTRTGRCASSPASCRRARRRCG